MRDISKSKVWIFYPFPIQIGKIQQTRSAQETQENAAAPEYKTVSKMCSLLLTCCIVAQNGARSEQCFKLLGSDDNIFTVMKISPYYTSYKVNGFSCSIPIAV